jgi:hypothetical protein
MVRGIENEIKHTHVLTMHLHTYMISEQICNSKNYSKNNFLQKIILSVYGTASVVGDIYTRLYITRRISEHASVPVVAVCTRIFWYESF